MFCTKVRRLNFESCGAESRERRWRAKWELKTFPRTLCFGMSIRYAAQPPRVRDSLAALSHHKKQLLNFSDKKWGGRERAETRVERAICSMKRNCSEGKKKAALTHRLFRAVQNPSHLSHADREKVASFVIPRSSGINPRL